jgi:type I restriction enzyme M protein
LPGLPGNGDEGLPAKVVGEGDLIAVMVRDGDKELWIYDMRTNKNFSLKTNPLRRADLDEFVECFHPANRHERQKTWSEENSDGRWRRYGYDELVARDKASLDIFWLRDESLEDGANLTDPDVLAAEIIEDLRAALEEFELIGADLAGVSSTKEI